MLHLNKAIIPDPDAPVVLDAHGGEAGPELVVIAVDHIQYHDRTVVTCAFRGSIVDVRGDRLAAVLVSAGLRPLGRLERRKRGVKPRPEGFDITGAVNDIGPRLRALREQTGLRIGELARALGCPLPNLSRVELGEWVPGAPGLARRHPGDRRGGADLRAGAAGDVTECRRDRARHAFSGGAADADGAAVPVHRAHGHGVAPSSLV